MRKNNPNYRAPVVTRDQGPRSDLVRGTRPKNRHSLPHQLSTSVGPGLHTLGVREGGMGQRKAEWGRAECFYPGKIESHTQTAIVP